MLIDWNLWHLYRKLYMGDEAAMEKFLSEICTQEWNMQQDAGRTWAEAVAVLKAEYPRHADMIDAFHLRWHEMIGGQIDDTVAILQETRKRDVPLYALTDWSQETFFDTVNRFDFLSWFRGIVISGAEKLIKPEPRIFQLLLDRYGLAAEHVVYIDDSPSNMKAAAALGMYGIYFVCADTLGAELANLGLLPNPTEKHSPVKTACRKRHTSHFYAGFATEALIYCPSIHARAATLAASYALSSSCKGSTKLS